MLRTKLGKILLLALIPSLAYGSGANELYLKDYEEFWHQWGERKTAAMECLDAEKMMGFLSLAVEMLGNAEVAEANSKTIQEQLLSNTECVLNGFAKLQEEERKRAIAAFLVTPLFASPTQIENALRNVWDTGAYSKVRDVYESLLKDR